MKDFSTLRTAGVNSLFMLTNNIHTFKIKTEQNKAGILYENEL